MARRTPNTANKPAPKKPGELFAVALSSYEPRDYSEKQGSGEYVDYGADNLYPQYLVELFNSSPTHRALCTTIALRVYGDGFKPSNLEALLYYDRWNLEDELRKAALDIKLQFGLAFEVSWSLDRQTVANVSHLPFENVRCGVMDENEVIQDLYYSTDWTDKAIEPTRYGRFNPDTRNEEPVQILYVKPFSPGSAYYPKPDYVGALPYIELEKEIGTYHINNIRNGLAPSFAVHFANGDPGELEQRQIKSRIERELSGPKNAGKFFVTFSDSPDRKPTIDSFPVSDLDKQYQFLSEETTNKIMIGHRVVSPAMFGVKTAGQLGNVQELEQAAELFDEQVTGPFRRVILDALNPLYQATGVNVEYQTTTAEVEAAVEFTGIQISSAIDVISKTKTGELDKNQAAQILQFMLGFSPEAVAQLFPDLPTSLSAEAPERTPVELADLEGEDEADILQDYELIDTRKVEYDQEDALDNLWTFARAIAQQGAQTSDQDTDIIKVRYAYAPSAVKDDKTRDFCRVMLDAGKVYRKEDIQAASRQAVNPGWGPRGANTYDIWLYKGGGSCRHFWERRTYLKKTNARVSVADAKKIIQRAGVDAERLEVNNPKVAKRPRDMENRGFLDPRKFNTPR